MNAEVWLQRPLRVDPLSAGEVMTVTTLRPLDPERLRRVLSQLEAAVGLRLTFLNDTGLKPIPVEWGARESPYTVREFVGQHGREAEAHLRLRRTPQLVTAEWVWRNTGVGEVRLVGALL